MSREITAEEVINVIAAHNYRWSNEDDLQEAIRQVLLESGLVAQREVRLSDRDRIDLLIDGIGIEVKAPRIGSKQPVSRVVTQLARYAQHVEIRDLVLVTTTHRHRLVPPIIGGIPVYVVNVGGLR